MSEEEWGLLVGHGISVSCQVLPWGKLRNLGTWQVVPGGVSALGGLWEVAWMIQQMRSL